MIPSFVPAWGFHPRNDATYFPLPWLLSTAGYGVLVDSPERSVWQLAGRRSWSVSVDAARLRLRTFAGPRPADALRRMSARSGASRPRPRRTCSAPGTSRRGTTSRRCWQACSAATCRCRSRRPTRTTCPARRSRQARRPSGRGRLLPRRRAGDHHVLQPDDLHDAHRASAPGALCSSTRPAGPYVFRYSTLQAFDVAQFDFTAPGRPSLYGQLLGEAVADGHDGWMEDFGEYTPLDARAAPRLTRHRPAQPLSDPVPLRALSRATRGRGRFIRSGWIGTARCAPVVWGGDPTVDWGFDGLRSVVTNGLTMGLSGVSRWGSDIGGYFALFENKLTPELLTRWIEVGAVSGVMRTQANGIRIPDSPRPQIWDAGMIERWRRWAKLRTQLYPYLAAADASYRRTGLPLMRHLALAYPDDPRAVRQDDEFLFGPDLLAAPVLSPGARDRSVYLPRGRWVDLWRSARYRSGDGGLSLGRARVLRGGRSVSLPAPLDELPLLARAGTLLPLLSPDVDTLAAYGDRAPAVSLHERQGERVLLAFPRGRSSARAGGRRVARLARAPGVVVADDPREAPARLDDLSVAGNPGAPLQAVHAARDGRPRRKLALRRREARPARDIPRAPRDAGRPRLLKPVFPSAVGRLSSHCDWKLGPHPAARARTPRRKRRSEPSEGRSGQGRWHRHRGAPRRWGPPRRWPVPWAPGPGRTRSPGPAGGLAGRAEWARMKRAPPWLPAVRSLKAAVRGRARLRWAGPRSRRLARRLLGARSAARGGSPADRPPFRRPPAPLRSPLAPPPSGR